MVNPTFGAKDNWPWMVPGGNWATGYAPSQRALADPSAIAYSTPDSPVMVNLLAVSPEINELGDQKRESALEPPLNEIQGMDQQSLSSLLGDITDREQSILDGASAVRRLMDENSLLNLVASGGALSDVLVALCDFVEHHLPDCVCVIYLFDREGTTLRNVAAGRLPMGFHDAIYNLTLRGDSTPCSRAAHLNMKVIAADVESDPLWQTSAFGALARAHGFRANWAFPICSSAGQVLGTVSIHQRSAAGPTASQQDFTTRVTEIAGFAIDRAQREATLKRREAFLAEAQRLSSTGSFSWRVSTDEITWSEHLYRVFEFDQREPLTFERIRSRVHPEDLLLFDATVKQARDTASNFEYEHRVVMEDDSVKYLRAVAHPTHDEEGRLEYIGAVQDVTQRRLSEAALAKARSELARVARIMSLGALTASIAHEIRQPLAGIVTNVSTSLRMLAVDDPDLEGVREAARRTLRDANRASDVITRLRDLFAKKTSTSESIDLNEVIREVIALFSNDFVHHRIILRQELEQQLPRITGDRIQIQQVILNLLQNAVDAVKSVDSRAKEVVITTQGDDDGRVRLSVQDTGVGVGSHAIDLFEPFHSSKGEGIGIGLFICRLIVESHFGRIWATPNEGHGVKFSFSVPCEPEDARNGARAGGDWPKVPTAQITHPVVLDACNL